MPTVDRRQTIQVCSLHKPLMETVQRLEGKFDDILERQIKSAEEIGYIKRKIDNGLRRELQDAVRESLNEFDKKYAGVVEFRWFRDFITGWRDRLFVNTIKLGMLIIVIIFALNTGDKLMRSVMDMVFK